MSKRNRSRDFNSNNNTSHPKKRLRSQQKKVPYHRTVSFKVQDGKAFSHEVEMNSNQSRHYNHRRAGPTILQYELIDKIFNCSQSRPCMLFLFFNVYTNAAQMQIY